MKHYVHVPANPLVASSGMPAWSTVALDALLGAGVVAADDLEPLSTVALIEVAAAFVRASADGVAFNPEAAISNARDKTKSKRFRDRRAAA